MDIWTPIPDSVADGVRSLRTGSLFDTLWKIGIVTLLVLGAWLLAQMGFFGAFVGGVIVATLFAPEVRAAVVDIYNRDFWTLEP